MEKKVKKGSKLVGLWSQSLTRDGTIKCQGLAQYLLTESLASSLQDTFGDNTRVCKERLVASINFNEPVIP